jgi:hypothetical protein
VLEKPIPRFSKILSKGQCRASFVTADDFDFLPYPVWRTPIFFGKFSCRNLLDLLSLYPFSNCETHSDHLHEDFTMGVIMSANLAAPFAEK